MFIYSDCVVKEESIAAQDDAAAKRLWKISEEMVGLNKWIRCIDHGYFKKWMDCVEKIGFEMSTWYVEHVE